MISFYLLIRGPPASGKTTLSKKIAEIYDAHHIPLDPIRKEHDLGFSEEDKVQAARYALIEAEKVLDKGQVVIIEEVFNYEKQIAQITDNISTIGYLFSLNTSLENCLYRNRNRDYVMADERIVNVHKKATQAQPGILIDTSKPIEETLSEIISYLPPRE